MCFVNMYNLACVSFSLLLLVLNVHCYPPTVRQTTNGPVEGIEQTSSLGQKYYAFKGIPFAEPPITGRDPYTGEEVDRRFKSPEPLKRTWTENFNAKNFGNICIPTSNYSIANFTKSEDCLFLNVYVPVGGAAKKTVLVWIHGGGFGEGESVDAMFGPDFLITEDNIVVTIQYRLGIFGFLNMGFGEYTGNMGLKDQQLALKWVSENIENFSGKKDEVLLFGESAGGASVHFQMLNEESRKYFNRAFSSSSSAFSFYAISEVSHLERMQRCLKTTDQEKLIEYLKTTNSEVLTHCHETKPNKYTFTLTPWAPTIEEPKTIGAFITKTPQQIYNSDQTPIMDAIFSFNSQESVTFFPMLLERTEPLLKKGWKDPNFELPFPGFNQTTHPEEYKEILEKLRKAYFPEPINNDIVKHGNINLTSDISFDDSILKAIVFQAKANNNRSERSGHKNTYLFRFSVHNDLNLLKIRRNLTYDGAGHADDLCYIFHCHMFDGIKAYDHHLEQKDKAYDAIMRMTKIITNFARTGNPSIDGDTPFESCKSATEMYCQEVSNDTKTSVTSDIMNQLHYETWREIEDIYKNSTKNQQ